jgi:integrase
MVDTDDVQGYSRKFENQRELLEDANINEEDRREIRRFIAHQRANTDNNLGTISGHLNKLRLSAERARMPLVEMEKPDVDVFLTDTLQDEYGLTEGSVRNYRKALRLFFGHLGRDWSEDITIGAAIERKVDPDECLSNDEIEAILDAAKNPRDKALVAVLADTGLRIGAALSFQMRHVNIDGSRATLTINPDANTKGDDGPKPLTWSRGYVANWIDVHPRPENPDAALFHKLRQWEEDEDGALNQGYAGVLIKKLANRAGLDKDRIKAKLFRSTAVSRWIREDMGEQAIKHRTGWSKDSRMFQVYSRVQDQEMNDVVFDHYDIGEERTAERPDLDQCPQCRTPLRGNERFCPGCASPLTAGAQDATDAIDDDLFESFGSADGLAEAIVAEARRRFKSDPEFRATLVEARESASHESSS